MGALVRTLWQGESPPGRFFLNHPGAQGLHPTGALTRTLWRINFNKIKTPPGQFYSNHLGARGLHPPVALARTLW